MRRLDDGEGLGGGESEMRRCGRNTGEWNACGRILFLY
jgi:hypothetical protein